MATRVSNRGVDVPEEVERAISGLGMAAAGANVIMQLSQLPVGHGVAESAVDSGRIDEHPIKRTRTTLAYLAVAMLGTEAEREAMRQAVNAAHRHVHSAPGDPVAYDAFDTELQLWVAACLYKGLEDVHEVLHGVPDPETADIVYRHSARLATTLQVRDEQWPPDRDAFHRYWDEMVSRIEMDDLTRRYLQGIAGAEFLGPVSHVVGPFVRLLSVGFLPPPFRAQLGLPWDARRQWVFDVVVGTAATVTRALPAPLRRMPFNLCLWDVRRRIRTGRALV